MKNFKLVAALVFMFSTHAYASGKSKVFVECVLRYTTITTCVDFKDSFFAQQDSAVERLNNPAGADLQLSVTDEQADHDHIGYLFEWTSQLPNTKGSVLKIPLVLSNALDNISTLNALTKNASKGFTSIKKIEDQTIEQDGSTVVTIGPPAKPASPTNPPQNNDGLISRLSKGPWLFTGSAGPGSYSSMNGGFKLFSIPLSGEAAYFQDRYKVDFTSTFSYENLSTPNSDGGRISGTMRSENYTGLAVYSLSKNWSIAVINTTSKTPASNLAFENETQTGVEWTLVPFRTNQNHELAFRVGPTYTTGKLNEVNYLNHLQENYFGVFTQIYLYWVAMTDKLTMSTTATGTENLKYHDNYNATIQGSVNFQLNQAIGLMGTANYSFLKTSLSYPLHPDFSNPLQAEFLGGQAGGTTSLTFGVNIRFGNSLRKMRDRRWSTQ